MSRSLHRTSAAFLSIAAIAACGGAASAPNTSPRPVAQQESSPGALPINLIQWSGSFRSAMQVTGDAGGSNYNSVTGGVRLTSAGSGATHVHITFATSAGIGDATNLHWAWAIGDCHDGALPAAPLSTFPDLSVSRDRGELDADVPLAMPTQGRYHVNIYWRESADEADVFTCAPLSMSKIK